MTDATFEQHREVAAQRLATLRQIAERSSEPGDPLVQAIEDLANEMEGMARAWEEGPRRAIETLVGDLQQERETLQTIMENTYTQLAYLDTDFNFVRVNSAYALGCGLSPEELIGHNHFALFPDRQNQIIFEWARDHGQPVEFYARPFEYADRPEQGITYWDWTLVPVKNAQGQVRNLVLSLLDVTERVLARQEREKLVAANREQQRLLEQLVAAAPIGIAVVGGPDHRYELVNPYYKAIPGMREVPLPGRTIAEVLPEVVARETLDRLNEVYATGQTVSLREQEARAAPGLAPTYWNVEHVPLSNGENGVDKVLILASDVTASIRTRRQVEDLAAEAQHQATEMAAVLEAMTDGVIIYDAAGIAQHANGAAIALFGLDPVGIDRESIGQELVKRYRDGRPVAVDDLPSSRALRGERVMNQRLLLTNTSDARHLALVSSAPLFREGLVSGAVLVWHDITARELAEEVRNRLIAILEQTPDMIATSSIDGCLLYLNRAGRQILGVADGADLSGRAFAAGYTPWANKIIEEIGIPTAIREGRWHGETAVLGSDGREIPMSQVIVAHHGPDGSVDYLSTIARDISERHRYLAQLEAERARLQAVIDHAPEAIVVVDRESRIVMANPAAQRLYARPLLPGQDFETYPDMAFSLPDGTPCDPRALPLTRSALHGESLQNVEMIICWPDDQQRDLLISSAPVRDVHGEIAGAVAVFQDVTEQRQIQTALRESQEKLQMLFRLLPVGVSVLDSDRNLIDANPALERMRWPSATCCTNWRKP